MLRYVFRIARNHYHVSRIDPDEHGDDIAYAVRDLKGVLGFFGVSWSAVIYILFGWRDELSGYNISALIVAFIIATMGMYFLWIGLRKRIELGIKMHNIFHGSRDKLLALQLGITDDRPGEGPERIMFEFVEDVAEYFRVLLNDSSAGCSIRMLEPDSENQGEGVFVTFWRSRNLNERQETSQPISAENGVGYAVRTREKGSGVFVLNGIKNAPPEFWSQTINDARNDIKNVMVAPINVLSETTKGKTCLGLMYVSSKHTRFQSWYSESLMGFADYAAVLIAHAGTKIGVSSIQNNQ